MVTTYHNTKELGRKTLKENDHVVLNGINYEVNGHYLRNTDGDNDQIFSVIGLEDDNQKYTFATKAYGYRSKFGSWPESNDKDFKALTRLVKALWRELKVVNVTSLIVMSIGDYNSTIHHSHIKVGCQIISFETVKKVYEIMLKMRLNDKAKTKSKVRSRSKRTKRSR